MALLEVSPIPFETRKLIADNPAASAVPAEFGAAPAGYIETAARIAHLQAEIDRLHAFANNSDTPIQLSFRALRKVQSLTMLRNGMAGQGS